MDVRPALLFIAALSCLASCKRVKRASEVAARTGAGAERGSPDAGPSKEAPPGDAALTPTFDVEAAPFEGKPGWFVIDKQMFDSHLRAARFVRDDLVLPSLKPTVLSSDLFANLRPGWFIVVYSSFDSREQAKEYAASLELAGIDIYVKQSGPVRAYGGAADAGVTTPRLIHVTGAVNITGNDSLEGQPRVTITLPNGEEIIAETTTDQTVDVWLSAVGRAGVSSEGRGLCGDGDGYSGSLELPEAAHEAKFELNLYIQCGE